MIAFENFFRSDHESSEQLSPPSGFAFTPQGYLIIANDFNHQVQIYDNDRLLKSFGEKGKENGQFHYPKGITTDKNGNIYVADSWNHRVQKFDSNGNLYFADASNHRIRKIDTSGNISTIAGTGTEGFSGDGGAATSATLDYPYRVTFDSNGNLYIPDLGNSVIRKVDTNGNISTFAGNGTEGYSGDGGAATSATLSNPWGVTVDASGNVYIADSENHRIRKVDTNGNISTFAGTGTSGYSGDGGAATSATFKNPENTLWYNNNLYIPDLNKPVWST